MELLFVYLLIINALGFILMPTDKYKAKKNLWRIPEATLFSVALFGGSIGVLCGMYTVRHKTKHASFTLGIPVIIAVQIVLGIVLFAL